ncbi:MAG: hypothetical protein CL608_11095 [Anaerolineaceae bacterium]|nr:hypothetical protein [Anaerolineaceae bacterium]
MLDLTHEPDLGYIFYPPETPHYPGHPRLDVVIPATPTYRHFDPQKVRFQVVLPSSGMSQITIHHPWSFSKAYHVCAGRIFITDRVPKLVEAFSFGGELQILSDAEHTVCALTSPAPIFALFEPHDLSMWITAEVEGLLARQKAHWDPQHPHDFETHLATLDPLLLYASCLQTLQQQAWPAHNPESDGPHFVAAEINRLQAKGDWPLVVPHLEQMFSS